jgi:hypothetical protein
MIFRNEMKNDRLFAGFYKKKLNLAPTFIYYIIGGFIHRQAQAYAWA